MDSELRFVSSLLYANKTEQDKFYAQKPPLKIFALRNREVSWLYRQYEIHGQFPSAKIFKTKFKVDLPKVRDAIGVTLQVIMDEYSFRQLQDLTDKTSKLIEDSADMDKVLKFFRDGAMRLETFSAEYDDIEWGKSKGALERYQSLIREKKMGVTVRVDTPWATLNKLIDFVKPGEFVCIFGRTSMGKTQLAIEWARYIVTQLKVKTLIVSKEMPTEQVEDRFEVSHLKLNPKKVRRAELSPKDQVRWLKFRQKMHDMPLVITGKETLEGIGLDDVMAKIEEHKPLVVVIDGAYLLNLPNSGRLTHTERYGEISRACKRIAKTTKTIVIGVIQQGRVAEKKNTTSGGLETIFGADAWAQDSDFLIQIGGKRGSDKREVILEKGRETGLGSFMINFRHDPYVDLSELKSAASVAQANGVPFDPTLKMKISKAKK